MGLAPMSTPQIFVPPHPESLRQQRQAQPGGIYVPFRLIFSSFTSAQKPEGDVGALPAYLTTLANPSDNILPRDELGVKLSHTGMRNGNMVIRVETANQRTQGKPEAGYRVSFSSALCLGVTAHITLSDWQIRRCICRYGPPPRRVKRHGNMVIEVETTNQRGEKITDGTAEVAQPPTVYVFTEKAWHGCGPVQLFSHCSRRLGSCG
jgi:hypothetical protein